MKLGKAILGALLAVQALVANAQGEINPTKPIRIVVGFTPGTSPEVVARILAEQMAKSTGYNMYVENKPGAAGTIAADLVAKSPPDGHTLMLGVAASLAVAPHLMPSVRYDPVKAFTPIGLIQRSPYYVVVDSKLGVRNLRELIDFDRKNPGALSMGVPGLGTPHHLVLELLMAKTGLKLTIVPFPGSPQMVFETISGRMSGFLEVGSPLVVREVRAGKLTYLAITDARRSVASPNTPTTVEQGVDLTEHSWWGLLGPEGMPPATVRRLNEALNQALASPTVRQRMKHEGFDEDAVRSSTPAELAEWIRREYTKAGEVIRNAGIKLQ